jgi:dephospho-CoA kinase
VFALVITGPPGAGKTEVLTALSDLLVADDIRHAAVEVEALTSRPDAVAERIRKAFPDRLQPASPSPGRRRQR